MTDRAVWAEIDLGAIRRNVERLVAHVGPAQVLAVVKANGYGHGGPESAKAALAGGANWLGVARIEEAEDIRAAGIDAPVLLLTEPPIEHFTRVVNANVTPTIFTSRAAEGFASINNCPPVHIKVDTGMHRYGVAPGDAVRLFKEVQALRLKIDGVWSHLAAAEQQANPMTANQMELFNDTVEAIVAQSEETHFQRHMSNSAAALTVPESRMDLVRAGLAIYGLNPLGGAPSPIELEPAMSFKSRVSASKWLEAGERLSYGAHHQLSRDCYVATVSCGYADGFPRSASGKAEILVGGQRYKSAGAITMDHFMVETGNVNLEVGEEAVIFGKQSSARVTVEELAGHAGTIPWEIVCGLSVRVPRIYVET